jgi:hypothetical protein
MRNKRNDFITKGAKERGITPKDFVKKILAQSDSYSAYAIARANAYKAILSRKADGGLFASNGYKKGTNVLKKAKGGVVAAPLTPADPYINYKQVFKRALGEVYPSPQPRNSIGYVSENTAPSVTEMQFQNPFKMESGGPVGLFDQWDREDEEDEADMIKQTSAPSSDEVESKQSVEPFYKRFEQNNADAMAVLLENLSVTNSQPMQYVPIKQGNNTFISKVPQQITLPSFSAPQGNGLQVVKQAALRHNVPPEILAGVYGAETSFGKNVKTSSAGAQGPFQFMPGTAKQYGVNTNDLESSADGAARYLSDLYKQFGNWEQAVAAYNAGPGNIKKGRIPEETRNYVPKVMGYAKNVKFQQGGTYDVTPEELQDLKNKGYKFKFVY